MSEIVYFFIPVPTRTLEPVSECANNGQKAIEICEYIINSN